MIEIISYIAVGLCSFCYLCMSLVNVVARSKYAKEALEDVDKRKEVDEEVGNLSNDDVTAGLSKWVQSDTDKK